MTEIAKTLDQGLMLLDVVSDGGPGSVAELADRSGLNRTVAHRLIATLEARGYLRRGPYGEVNLGSALLVLGDKVEHDLRAAAAIPLKLLAGATKETAVLTVVDGGEAVAIDQWLTHHRVRADYGAGYRHPLGQAAHGRAILAFVDEDDSDLDEVRQLGYAASRDELQEGAAGVAAPIRDRSGSTVASIGIVAPVDRMPAEDEVAPKVVRAAADVSRALGYRKRGGSR